MSTVVILGSDTMGRGDDALGAKLVGSFLRALASHEPRPEAVVFYNSAVRLLAPESPHLEPLRALDDAGVDLLACITCLEHWKLAQRIAVGTISHMREIVQRTLAAEKVVTI
jgi:selenium metabolism protein YedF